MPPAPSGSYHHGDLDRAALDAAEALLAEAGEAGVTMREVARRVGVTHRAIYRWRADRRALLEGLAERGFRRLAASVRQAVEGASDPRQAFVEAYLRFARREPALYRLTMSRDRREFRAAPELRAAVNDLVAASLETFGAVEPDPRDFVVALWALLHGAISFMEVGLLAIADEATFVAYATALSDRVSTRPSS